MYDGVELAFMSTTTDREVAKTYARGSGGRAATIFEIKMGMVDRGADISSEDSVLARDACIACRAQS